MAREPARFRRESPRLSGAKIASRRDVNPGLGVYEAVDDEPFLTLLRRRYGEPDRGGDLAYSYTIHDAETGIDFTAYSGPTGPAYRGSPPELFVDLAGGDNRTKPEVLAVLADFERWLEADEV